MYLRTLGDFELRGALHVASLPTQRARALLSNLVIEAPRALSRERLARRFWGSGDPEKARRSLKTAIWSIRAAIRSIGEDPDKYLVTDGPNVCWVTEIPCDYSEMLALSKLGDSESDRRALETYRGPFLEGDYGDWAAECRETAESAYAAVLARELTRRPSIEIAQRLLSINPYDDNTHAALIGMLLDLGQLGAAADAAARYRQILEEFGAEPSAEIERELQARLAAANVTPGLTLATVPQERRKARFVDMLRSLAYGNGFVALLSGEPGLGKTAAAAEFAALARSLGVPVTFLDALDSSHEWAGPWANQLSSGHTVDSAAMALRATAGSQSIFIIDNADAMGNDALSITTTLASLLVRKPHGVVLTANASGAKRVTQALSQLQPMIVSLEPFTLEQTGESLREIAPTIDADAVRILHATSAGNPLHLLSLLQAMASEGTLMRTGATWELSSSNIPAASPTLASSVAERLKLLTEEQRSVLHLLALDVRLSAEDVAEILGLTLDKAIESIETLVRGALLISGAVSGLRFRHEAERSAIERSLDESSRDDLHHQIARRLENSPNAARVADRIADHYAAAGRSREAAGYRLTAASNALSASAWSAALNHADDGIAQVQSMVDPPAALLGELYAMRSRSKLGVGLPREALDDAARACELARIANDESVLSQSVQALARSRYALDDIPGALESLEFLIGLAGDDRSTKMDAIVWKVYMLRYCGRVGEALELANEWLTYAREAGAWNQVLRLIAESTNCYLLLRDAVLIEQTLAAFNNTLARAGGVDVAFALLDRASWYHLAGDDDLTFATLRTVRSCLGVGTSGPVARPSVEFLIGIQEALVYADSGRWTDVLRVTETLSSTIPYRRIANWKEKCDILRAEALLSIGDASGVDSANLLSRAIGDGAPTVSLMGFGQYGAALRAEVGAVTEAPDAHERLISALRLGARAAIQPLGIDRTYGRLAAVALDAGFIDVHRRALEQQRQASSERIIVSKAIRDYA